jgi:hypothetical protein
MTYSVSDSIVVFTPGPTPSSRSSISYVHRIHTQPSPHPRSSRSHTLRSFGFLCVWSGLLSPTVWPLLDLPVLCFCNPVYERSLDPSVLVFSLSLYRHPFICILFSSRFTSYNKQQQCFIWFLVNRDNNYIYYNTLIMIMITIRQGHVSDTVRVWEKGRDTWCVCMCNETWKTFVFDLWGKPWK